MEQLPDVAQLPLHFPDAAQRRYELIRPVLLAECTATERATQTHHHPDTIGKLKATKQINVAVSADSFPMSFIKDQRDPVGYSIDLCKRVIAQLGRAAGVPDLKITWVAGTVAERIAMVASGKADEWTGVDGVKASAADLQSMARLTPPKVDFRADQASASVNSVAIWPAPPSSRSAAACSEAMRSSSNWALITSSPRAWRSASSVLRAMLSVTVCHGTGGAAAPRSQSQLHPG